ncbi:MAG TPA: hypothetical protein VF516_43030 [Kofleriaceae bacterium]
MPGDRAESLGRAQLVTAKIEALVAKRASDSEWKELLITAPDQVCRETNKIDSQDPKTGKITYRQVCHYTGAHMVEVGPDPVDVPVELAAGLQPGRYARFSRISIEGHMRSSPSAPKLPLEVYRGVQKQKDDFDRERESGKHLIALYGFLLE